MGFRDYFHRRKARTDPQDSTSGSVYRAYYGHTTAGKTVTERSSMQVTAVYACVRVLAEAVASLPLHLYREEDDSKVKATDHPLYFLLHSEPNEEMTAYSFWETLMTHLLLWGNAYVQIIRNGKGEVTALYPLMPNRMTVDRDESGHIYYQYLWSKGDDAPTMKETIVKLSPHEVMQIPGLGFDGLVGYSPIAMAKNSIGLSMACEEYGSKFFENGAAPSGVLEHPGVLKDPEKVRDSWQAAFGGSQNAGKVAVLEEGMKYSPISINPQEAQFLDTRKFQIDEIARIFRVPPHMIGDLEHATFSNIEEQSLEFVTYSLQPWLTRIESSISRSLLTREEKLVYYARFNVDGLLRGNYASRMQGYATGINNGFLCVNDVRRLENMDLVPDAEGGNLFLVNGSMTPLKDAGAAYANGTGGANDPSKQEKSEPEQSEQESDEPEQEPGEDTENEKPHKRGRRMR
jgi:HK97 family phage portal protein